MAGANMETGDLEVAHGREAEVGVEALVLTIREGACLVAGEQIAVGNGSTIESGGQNGVLLRGFRVFFHGSERIVADEEKRTRIAGLRVDGKVVLRPLGTL